MEKEIDNTNYKIGSLPNKQKLYSTQDIAEMLNCTTSVVRNIVSYYHILSEREERDKRIRRSLFSYEAFKLIKEYRDKRVEKANRKPIVQSYERTEEEIAALKDHSFVTDSRCLDLNWWPETVPSVFVDDED